MKILNKASTKVFLKLIEGLKVGKAKKIDNSPGTFMAVHVDRLSEHLYSVAHNHIVQGDVWPDPDVEFYVVDDVQLGQVQVAPTAIDHGNGHYRRAVEFDNDKPTRIARASQADIAAFCDVWMTNIKEQQRIK